MKTYCLFFFLAVAFCEVGQAQPPKTDVVAIKAVIEQETQSWLNVDQKAWLSSWADVPEAHLLYSETGGKVHQIKMPAGMKGMLADQKPSNAKFKNTNYQIRVNGNAAFAQFDQEFSGDDGSHDQARETRYLEKTGRSDGSGQWKIVHVGALYYNPEPTDPKAIDPAILSANKTFMQNFSQGATDMGTLYASDAQLLPPNGAMISGNTAIGPFWKNVFGMGIKNATLETTQTENAGDRIIETGNYTLAGADGKPMDNGKYMVIWKSENGQWKLYRDIWNSSMAAK